MPSGRVLSGVQEKGEEVADAVSEEEEEEARISVSPSPCIYIQLIAISI